MAAAAIGNKTDSVTSRAVVAASTTTTTSSGELWAQATGARHVIMSPLQSAAAADAALPWLPVAIAAFAAVALLIYVLFQCLHGAKNTAKSRHGKSQHNLRFRLHHCKLKRPKLYVYIYLSKSSETLHPFVCYSNTGISGVIKQTSTHKKREKSH